MHPLQKQVERAQHSRLQLWLLNRVLLHTVPFNKPHGLKVLSVKEDGIIIGARNRKANRNHIKGIHACLLATLCEYVSGLSLLVKLDPAAYRIILKHIHMTYHYQAKTGVTAKFHLDPSFLQHEIIDPLQQQEAIFREFTVEVYDEAQNHICTGLINWQIKAWTSVKTRA